MHRLLLAAVLCGACEGVRLNVREPAAASACAGVSSRVDCGYENITPDFCTARGCCYAAEAGQPSCYYPSDGVAIKRVHVVQSNHFDAGYTDTTTNVVNEYFTQFFPRAAALGFELESQAVNASSPRLRWLTQAYLVSLYLNCPPNQGLQCPNSTEIATFKDAVGKGWITWHAFPHNAEMAEMAPNMVEHALQLVSSLDRTLSVAGKTVLSQRDVPGFPRSAIPLLRTHGVSAISVGGNGRVNPPNVPPAFVWRDGAAAAAGGKRSAVTPSAASVAPPSQESMLVFWHGYGYGAVSATTGRFLPEPESLGATLPVDSPTDPEAPRCQMPGFDEAMVYAWNGDNAGPPGNAQAVAGTWGQVAQWYPGAEIIASTLDDFTAAYRQADEQSGGTLSAQLPMVTQDLSDTWVMGGASDPWKVSHARAVARAYLNCTGSCIEDPQVQNATRQFIKNGEHTWGSSLGGMGPLQDNSYDNPTFHQQLATNQSNLQFMQSTWIEQRNFGFTYPMQALAGHPLQQSIEAEFSKLSPGAPPAVAQMQRIPASAPINMGWSTVTPSPHGSIQQVSVNGKPYPGDFGSFVYQTLNDDVFAAWRADYLLSGTGGDNYYGKPNVNSSMSPNATYLTTATWYLQKPSTLVAELQVNTTLHTSFGAPEVVYITYDFAANSTIGITLQMFNKTATRLPEATYFRFVPSVPSAGDIMWQMDKLGTWTNPLDVLDGASKGLHAVASGVLAQTTDNATMFFESRDSSLVRWGPGLYPFCAPMVGDIDVTQGVAYVLHDNSWNTNFPLWYPFADPIHQPNGSSDFKWAFNIRF
ncbi:hypothetical protein DIPPA_09975 [Diplonema papillatum]|nr:hypothetical protein DIPPA_09975 [Diplonema papillatum]